MDHTPQPGTTGILLLCLSVGGGSLHAQTAPPPVVQQPAAAGVSAAQTGVTVRTPTTTGTCSIAGTVTGTDGGIVPGAAVELMTEGNVEVRATHTDVDGTYRLESVRCGQYVLTVGLAGFLPIAIGESLPDSGGEAQVNVTLRPGLNSEVTVVATQKEIVMAQVHLEEQQRLVGMLPNFFVSYQWHAAPLPTRQKFVLALRTAIDPGNVVLTGIVAGAEQAANSFPGYGQGAAGYGSRFGSAYGGLVTGTFLGGAILPTLFRQDPRYFYKGTGTVKSRTWYAISRAFVTRGDNGNTQVNWSGMLGDLGSGALTNTWLAKQDRQAGSVTVENGLLGIGSDCFNNLLEEFLLRKFTTKTKGRKGQASDTP